MRPPSEQLRMILHYGTLTFVSGEWVFRGNPSADCPVIEMRDASKWKIVQAIYDLICER